MRKIQLTEKEIAEVLSLRGLRAEFGNGWLVRQDVRDVVQRRSVRVFDASGAEVLACRVRSNSGKSINGKLAELLVRS